MALLNLLSCIKGIISWFIKRLPFFKCFCCTRLYQCIILHHHTIYLCTTQFFGTFLIMLPPFQCVNFGTINYFKCSPGKITVVHNPTGVQWPLWMLPYFMKTILDSIWGNQQMLPWVAKIEVGCCCVVVFMRYLEGVVEQITWIHMSIIIDKQWIYSKLMMV